MPSLFMGYELVSLTNDLLLLYINRSGPPPGMFPGPPRSSHPGVMPPVVGPPRMMSRLPHALPAGPPTVMSRAGGMPPHTMMSTRPPTQIMQSFPQVMLKYRF